jgi:hypothetical protein
MHPTNTAIRAEIIGDDTAVALGGTRVRAYAPVLALCRALVAAGHDPALVLEAYRGETRCLRVRSIGEAADLEISEGGFRPARKPDAGPPMRGNEPGGPKPCQRRAVS